MRILLALAAAAVTLLLGVIVLGGLAARAVVDGQRERLLARAREALGRPVVIEGVAASFWPLGVRLRGLRVGDDPAFGAAPFLAADQAVVRVRAWPLLRGRLETSGLLLRRPELRLLRDERGRWNVASLGVGEPEGGRGAAAGAASGRAPAGVPGALLLGVALAEIRDGTVVIRDQAGERPREVVLRRVRARAENVHAGGDARLGIEAALPGAGERPNARLALRVPALGARAPRDTPFELEAHAEGIDLAPLAGALAATRVGRVALAAQGTPQRCGATLDLAWTRGAEDALAGTLGARATRDGDAVTLDEAAGTAGSVTWTARGALALAEEGVRIAAAEATIDGMPLAVSGLVRDLSPPVLDLRFTGRPYGGSAAGAVTGDGGGLRLSATWAGIDLAAVGGRIGTDDARRFEGRARGALDLRLVGGALSGGGELNVSEGRIGGVNLARTVLGTFDAIPLLPPVFGSKRGAGSPELAGPDTTIRSASIPFVVAGERVRSERLRLVGAAFEITGGGWIDFDHRLRFTGDLVLAPEVSDTLTAGLGVLRYLRLDDLRLSLPFRVRGRLGKAKVEPDLGRLRDRGLALLGRRARPAGERSDRRAQPRSDHGLGDALLEHLERMVDP